jgi:hypothetical protein
VWFVDDRHVSRLRFIATALRAGLPTLWSVVGVITLLFGGSVFATIFWLKQDPLLALVTFAITLILVFTEGAHRLWLRSQADLAEACAAAHRVQIVQPVNVTSPDIPSPFGVIEQSRLLAEHQFKMELEREAETERRREPVDQARWYVG